NHRMRRQWRLRRKHIDAPLGIRELLDAWLRFELCNIAFNHAIGIELDLCRVRAQSAPQIQSGQVINPAILDRREGLSTDSRTVRDLFNREAAKVSPPHGPR